MKILYIKSDSNNPARAGEIVKAFPNDHIFSDREKASVGYVPIFGIFTMDLTSDEVVLVNGARRKVDDPDNPTNIISVD